MMYLGLLSLGYMTNSHLANSVDPRVELAV